MADKSTSYSHRGALERRRRRARRYWIAAGLLTTGTLVVRDHEPSVATAAPIRKPLAALVRGGNTPAPAPLRGESARSAALLAPAPGRDRIAGDVAEREVTGWNLKRWHRVYRFAGHYGVSPDLATQIHDIALAEGIEPDLAFRLVRAESEFNTHATSKVGAVGLTQVMPGTARYYVRGVTRQRLYDPHVNLHVGFRYLRGLIHQYKSLHVALLVYNRGPVAVDAALANGDDPTNGYDQLVTKGYHGAGVVGR
jgi:hypothetical protein